MRGYRLTLRGWTVVVVLAAVLTLSIYAIAVSASSEQNNPDLQDYSPAVTPTPPEVPSLKDDPSTSDDPSPMDDPSPLDDPSPSDELSPSDEPSPQNEPSPPDEPSPQNDPSPSDEPSPQNEPSPPNEPSPHNPSPTPVVIPSPSPPPPAEPTPPQPSVDPEPTPLWADGKAAVMFDFDSTGLSDPERAVSQLNELLPPVDELNGYVVVVSAYTASDETAENLAQLRADTVAELLTGEFYIPSSYVRTQAGSAPGGNEPYRQRADVYFLYVGNK